MKNSQKYCTEEVAEEFTKDELVNAMMEACCHEYPRAGFMKMTKEYMAGYLMEDLDVLDEDYDVIDYIKGVDN